MLYKESVLPELISVLKTLQSIPELEPFRLVGGTAISLQIRHRLSIDIDLFSNQRLDKSKLRHVIGTRFRESQLTVTQNNIFGEINGVRVELYDDWSIPFRRPIINAEGIRLAALEDLAAFKLSAITGRREKKDYIDLYFLFEKLGTEKVLSNFKNYEPLMSPKSILFALSEIDTALTNTSPMPQMITKMNLRDVKESMLQASRLFLSMSQNNDQSRGMNI